MKLRRIFPFLLSLLALFGLAVPPARAQKPGTPGRFDYYVLDLSWAPQFCAHVVSSPECRAHPGFVLHGLWPQYNNGSWPANCDGHEPPPTSYSHWLGMTPSLSLLHHEWHKHGECTLLTGNQFFTDAQKAYDAVKIPRFFVELRHAANVPPRKILAMFLRANPSFSAANINLSCYRNQLSSVQVCLSQSLQPVACTHLHPCRGASIHILPPGKGEPTAVP